VYEAIVQAKNQYGWNEVIMSFDCNILPTPAATARQTLPNASQAEFSLIIYIIN